MMTPGINDPRRVGTIWMLNLGQPLPDLTPVVNATFQRVGLESAVALAETRGDDTTAEICRRFETGRRCYAALVDGALASYGWVSFDEEFVGELNLQLKFLQAKLTSGIALQSLPSARIISTAHYWCISLKI